MKTGALKGYLLDGWRPYLWIASAVVLLYAKSLSFGYTFLDDNVLILKDISFLMDIGNAGRVFAQKVFAGSYLPYYRPLLTLSFMLDAQIGGASPAIYHASNILYHLIATSLVFLFLVRLGYARLQAFVCALIFAVHPVLSQGTAWIPGRNDTILAVFVLASSVSFIGFIGTGKGRYLLGHLACFLAALFTKETALVLVPLCALYLHLMTRERLFSRAVLMLAAGWAAMALVWYLFRRSAIAGSFELSVFEMLGLLAAYLPAALQFAGKIFFPFNLSVFPIIPDTTFVYGAAAMALLAIAVIATRQKRYNFIFFGLAWAALFLAPSLIRASHAISADFIEHRVYVPIIGIFIILLETDMMKKAKDAPLLAAAGIVVAAFSVITFIHIDNFRDRLSFWSNAVKTSPHSPFAHLALAQAHYDAGRLDGAFAEYRRALTLDPYEPGSLYGLGECYLKEGSLANAEACFRKTIAVYPYVANPFAELGVVYYKQGRLEQAERVWLRALEIEPNNVATLKFLAIYYNERQDRERAAEYVRRLRAVGLEPPAEFLKSLDIQ